ncbi:MAG: MBL fold metallo-hydrolase [Gemmatimonadota bacterium]
MNLDITPFVAPGFGENGYVVRRDGAATAVVIDPGSAVLAMLRFLSDERLELEAILLTHAHIDHIEGVARLARETSAPIHLHPADRFLYDHVAEQGSQFGMHVEPLPPPDRELAHGQQLRFGDVSYDVRHVPGHSPGHVLFHVADDAVAFTGDVVFQSSIGRTDLHGGDFAGLLQSIRTQVLSLPGDTTLYPGHGPPTTVGHEAATNPFLVPHYGGGLA